MKNSNPVSHFAMKLRQLRDESNLTMEEFCERYNLQFDAKINKSTLSRYENQTQEPMLSTVKKIAEFFNVDASELLGYKPTPNNDEFVLSTREMEVIIAYRNNMTMQAAVDRLLGLTTEERNMRPIYRAANSEQHSEHGIEQRDEAALQRLAAAPKVKKEEDL